MGATGVLGFIRGIDLSTKDFSENEFPEEFGDMTGLRWLKLNSTNLTKVPEVLSQLQSLEHLHVSNNKLASIHGEVSDLKALRSVIARHNQVKTSGIPSDMFDMVDLSIVDFSHNLLRDTPENLHNAKGSIVLNLAHNQITALPKELFVQLLDLMHLDLSGNKLDMLPPQIRRLAELQVLILNDNPLLHFNPKQLPAMQRLRVLHMSNTQRNMGNIPASLDNLDNLEDVDLSQNELPAVPDCLFKLKRLRKLNLSDNKIKAIDPYCECWYQLQVLNLSRNQLVALPGAIVKMVSLRRLFVNENQLDFNGIPAGIGKLVKLEVFQASYNRLEMMPEGFTRCVGLRRVRLDHNRLVTLPATIHLLPDVEELDLHANPDLIMPPKPSTLQQGSGLAFYNIDFSLEHQRKLANAASPSSSMSASPGPSSVNKDLVAKKIQFLRRRKNLASDPDKDQAQILKGMVDVAKERDRVEQERASEEARARRWDEQIARQQGQLDYADLFDEDTGQSPGLTVFEIENFLPNLVDPAMHGKFYEGDCYVVLQTFETEEGTGGLDHRIFYWIGERASLDKKACAAIHAVNLRNHLMATCRTQREEMEEESDEFVALFGEIAYVEGGRTLSGFFTVEETKFPTRLYWVTAKGSHVHLEPVPLDPESLDPRYVFLLDAGKRMIVWAGVKSRGVIRSKTRLFAEKINKNERKGESEVDLTRQGDEVADFWVLLMDQDDATYTEPIIEHYTEDVLRRHPILYEVRLGNGYLELPQVEVPNRVLKQEILNSRAVYILDCDSDLFVWIGRRSTRLVRAAGFKCALELKRVLYRPSYTVVHKVCEGTEGMLFKSKFTGWDDVIAVDFTRTADSVQRRGADVKVILERDKMKTDLAALFVERTPMLGEAEAEQIMADCNEDIEMIQPFVLSGRKFVKLPDDEYGIFYSMDCYVFLCRYWAPPPDDELPPSDAEGAEEEEPADDFYCVVYFWQGRDASNMGWLTFTFTLQRKFENLFRDKLEVVRMQQQQENHKFLSHFKKHFVIRKGRRGLSMLPGTKRKELFSIRANGGALSTRIIQLTNDSSLLNSEFVSIQILPFNFPDEDGNRGIIYIWVGSKANPSDVRVAQEVCRDPAIGKVASPQAERTGEEEEQEENVEADDGDAHDQSLHVANLNPEGYRVIIVPETQEPEEFFEHISGRKPHDTDAEFMRHSRLFRCTNEKGYFTVSEKTIDFCQDDLDDDDIMLLDNGEAVFIWVGSNSSEVEVKLAYKSAQVYVQHLRSKEGERARRLCLTLKGKESRNFTKCFHAWSKHKLPPA